MTFQAWAEEAARAWRSGADIDEALQARFAKEQTSCPMSNAGQSRHSVGSTPTRLGFVVGSKARPSRPAPEPGRQPAGYRGCDEPPDSRCPGASSLGPPRSPASRAR